MDHNALDDISLQLAMLVNGDKNLKQGDAFNALYVAIDSFFDVYKFPDKDRIEALNFIRSKVANGRPQTKIP